MADQTKPDEKRATYPEAERSFLSVEWERIAKSQRQTINRLEQECDQYAAVVEKVREWAENVLPMKDAVALRDVLATAPADALAEHDARIWDDAYGTGVGDGRYNDITTNPYRKEQP